MHMRGKAELTCRCCTATVKAGAWRCHHCGEAHPTSVPSDHLEPVCNCPLRRRGTDVYHILVLAGVLETYKNFASLLCFCVVKICTQHRSGVASISTILARPSNGLARQGIDASAVTEQRACT